MISLNLGVITNAALVLALLAIPPTYAAANSEGQEPTIANQTFNPGGDDELSKQHCDDSPATIAACRSFIKGFLQGALLTDAAIIQTISSKEPRSAFKERVLRTRTSGRMQSPTQLAGFCLPADRTILDLANETLDHVKESERNSRELAKNVYASLKTDYPCGE